MPVVTGASNNYPPAPLEPRIGGSGVPNLSSLCGLVPRKKKPGLHKMEQFCAPLLDASTPRTPSSAGREQSNRSRWVGGTWMARRRRVLLARSSNSARDAGESSGRCVSNARSLQARAASRCLPWNGQDVVCRARAGPCLGHPIRGRRSRPGAVALAPRPRLQQRGEPVFSHALPVVFHRATSSPPAQRREEAGRVFTTSQRAAEALCG